MNFVCLRSSRLHILKFESWFMHWQQRRERKVEKSYIAFLESIPRVKGELVPFFCISGFWGVWSAVPKQSDRFWQPAWPVLGTGMTGLCPVLALVQGKYAYVQGSSCMLWWLVLFAWAWFCLGCVEPLPLPKGSETCLLQVILFFAFLRLSISCWSLFLLVSFLFLFSLVTICVCCQCTHQGGIEDHVWFEDRWMVASWCDEWLTTLCGLILG
jgi:hypothetical protein